MSKQPDKELAKKIDMWLPGFTVRADEVIAAADAIKSYAYNLELFIKAEDDVTTAASTDHTPNEACQNAIKVAQLQLVDELMEKKRVYGYDENGDDDYAIPLSVLQQYKANLSGGTE